MTFTTIPAVDASRATAAGAAGAVDAMDATTGAADASRATAADAGAEAKPAGVAGTDVPRKVSKFTKNRFASWRKYAGIGRSGWMPVSSVNFESSSVSTMPGMVTKLNLKMLVKLWLP